MLIPAEDADLSMWSDPVVKIAVTCEAVPLVVFSETTEARWLACAHGKTDKLPAVYLISPNGKLLYRGFFYFYCFSYYGVSHLSQRQIIAMGFFF